MSSSPYNSRSLRTRDIPLPSRLVRHSRRHPSPLAEPSTPEHQRQKRTNPSTQYSPGTIDDAANDEEPLVRKRRHHAPVSPNSVAAPERSEPPGQLPSPPVAVDTPAAQSILQTPTSASLPQRQPSLTPRQSTTPTLSRKPFSAKQAASRPLHQSIHTLTTASNKAGQGKHKGDLSHVPWPPQHPHEWIGNQPLLVDWLLMGDNLSRTTKDGSGLQKVGQVYEEAAQYVIDCKKAKNSNSHIVYSGNSARHAIGNILSRVKTAHEKTSTTGSGTIAGMTVEQQREAYAPCCDELWQRMQKVPGKLSTREMLSSFLPYTPSQAFSTTPLESTPVSRRSPSPTVEQEEGIAYPKDLFDSVDGLDPYLQDDIVSMAGPSSTSQAKDNNSTLSGQLGSFLSWYRNHYSIEDERTYLRKRISQLEKRLEEQQQKHNDLLASFYEIKAENKITKAAYND